MHAILSRLSKFVKDLYRIVLLPSAELQFLSAISPAHVADTYRRFTARHPRLPLFRRKTIGAALFDTGRFDKAGDYLDSIARRKLVGELARRARKRGYRLAEIDRNQFIDDIYAINASIKVRQGRVMAPSYATRVPHYTDLENYRYYGMLDTGGRLVAYCEVGLYGNFALFSRLLGYRNNDGVMHLMLSEILSRLIDEKIVRFVMYDMYFGASEGLRNFKTMLGFQPYRVRYRLL
jgi:hypothetical protein